MNMVYSNKFSGSLLEQGRSGERSIAPIEEETEEVICLFCKREVKNKCTVNNNEHLLNAMASVSIKYYALPSVTDYGCFECIKTILVLSEQRRIFQRNILKNRANHFVRTGNKEMCAKFLAETKEGKNNILSSAPGPSNFKITDVRTITRNETDDNSKLQNGFDSIPSEDHNDNSPNKLLDIMYEQPESVLATESGGNVHDCSMRSVSSTTNSNLYRCQFCPRAYSKPGYLRKHEKRHTFPILKRPRIKTAYVCKYCDICLDTRLLLKKHLDTHRSKYKCSLCEAEFYIRSALELHEAVCLGKKGAIEENGRRQYFTRSQKTVPSDSESDSDAEFETESYYSDRVKRWIVDAEANHDADSRYSVSTANSLLRRSTFVTVPTRFVSATESTEAETEADSTTSSIFSKRRRIRAKDSVRNGNRARKRKYISVKNKKWICPEEGCGYMDASLDSLMSHDIECHEPLALFYCKKCRGRFVRRFYLEQHLRFQSYGRWVCCLCESQFDNEPDLKYHFEEHNDSDRHYCEICRLTFITDHELQKHLCTSDHFNRKKIRKCIFLERRKYKHSVPEPPEPESPTKYRSVIKILKLMDQERTDRFSFISWRSTWKQGVVFQIRPNKSHNCAGLVLPRP